MIDSPFHRTQNGVFSIKEERIDRSSGECRISRDVIDSSPNASPQQDGYSQGADQRLDPATGSDKSTALPEEPIYIAHIALSRTSIFTDQGLLKSQPGMAVTSDIKTG
jgi:hypothetical protein